jgi:hypothetical protein
MKWMRFWAGACLVLIASGCSDDDGGTIENEGVYSPLIVGIAADNEPAVRGAENELTVLVTNVNQYPLTYHWSAAAGTLLDSTAATVTWVAPETPGTYPVTVSIQAADDDGTPFFKSATFQIFVDNEYERWTTSQEIQFDPAPVSAMAGGGVIFAQYRSVVTGEAEVYHVPAPGMAPEKKSGDGDLYYLQAGTNALRKTRGFLKLSGPYMREDGQQIAFAAKAEGDSQLIWVIPGAGIGATDSLNPLPRPYGPFTVPVPTHRNQANARYAHQGDWLLYNSDSATTGASVSRPWFRDSENLFLVPPIRVIGDVSLLGRSFWMPNWGPDIDSDGLPDSVVCVAFIDFGGGSTIPSGLYKLPSQPPQTSASQWLNDPDAAEPDWSPDGQHIVFADKNPSGERDIWIIRSDTNNRDNAIRVTSGPADDGHPRFSADGNTIYFVSNRADRYGLNGIFNTERRGYNIWSVRRFDRP